MTFRYITYFLLCDIKIYVDSKIVRKKLLTNFDAVTLLITLILREAVSFFENYFWINFVCNCGAKSTRHNGTKLVRNHLRIKKRSLPWNISTYSLWRYAINYWIQLTLQKCKLFSRDIQIFHLWKLREIFKEGILFRSNPTFITIYSHNIYVS